jgi:hypothetical protein
MGKEKYLMEMKNYLKEVFSILIYILLLKMKLMKDI